MKEITNTNLFVGVIGFIFLIWVLQVGLIKQFWLTIIVDFLVILCVPIIFFPLMIKLTNKYEQFIKEKKKPKTSTF